MYQDLIPHLFRTEFRRITSVLSKTFGLKHIEEAEDIASETFVQAFETWSFKGMPDNPTAWLYAVAKNKAINYLNRNQIFKKNVAHLKAAGEQISEIDIDLSEQNITDSQLQMMFAISHPALAPEAQVGLALRILCGLGVDEIANALLSTKEAISKRLYRARQSLREADIQIVYPPPGEIDKRLETVLTILYLLFTEGYYSESHDVALREDLCWEAIRLTCLLAENKETNQPAVNALLALMYFQASRFKARKGAHGQAILYHDQDDALWDRDLIASGAFYLQKASHGSQLSKYHLEAGIAYWHTIKPDTEEKWENILQLFNQLLLIEYSPIAALNRTFALSKVKGHQAAIEEAEKLQLTNNPFYFALLGELYTNVDNEKARMHFENALALTRTDRQIIQQKLDQLAGR